MLKRLGHMAVQKQVGKQGLDSRLVDGVYRPAIIGEVEIAQ